MTRRSIGHLGSLIAGVAALAAGCPPGASAPTIVAVGVATGGTPLMPLDFGPPGNIVTRRRYTIFGGTAAQSVGIGTFRAGVTPASPLLIRAADDTVVATQTGASVTGEAIVRVPGNVAILESAWDGVGTAPTIRMLRVDVATTGSVAAPPVQGSFRMQLNQPVELFFRAAARSTYYLFVEGIGDKTVDVVLDGPGRMHVSDPSLGRIVLDATTGVPLAGAPTPLAVVDATTGGVISLPRVTPARDTLLLTVSNLATGDFGHARVSVNHLVDRFPLTVWFNTAVPPGAAPAFGGRTSAQLTAVMRTIANETSKALYQATSGRARLGPITVLASTTPPPPSTHVDVQVEPIDHPPRGHVLGFQDMPLVSIHLDEDWWRQGVPACGMTLAHELFHYRYTLPDEYREALPLEPQFTAAVGSPCTNCRCPGSIMSGPGDELCWRGNHNPFHDPALGARTTNPLANLDNSPMWQVIAWRLQVTPPTSSPVRVLRFDVLTGGSTVVFPP
jgi:hypothetical protein